MVRRSLIGFAVVVSLVVGWFAFMAKDYPVGIDSYLTVPRPGGSTVGGGLAAASPTPSATTWLATATPRSSSSPLPQGTQPSGTPLPGDAATAAALVRSYLTDPVDSDWAAAYATLAPEQRTTLAAFAAERSSFMQAVRGRFVDKAPTHDASVLANWLTAPDLAATADQARAFIVEVDYPAIAPDTNANFEIYLAPPDASGHWYVWDLR